MCDLPFKIVLIAVNIVAFIIGVALVAVGALMNWGQDFIQSLFKKYLHTALGALGQADGEQVASLVHRILTTTGPLGMAIFIIGIIITIIAIVGFVGVCCGKWILYVYAALVGVMAIAVLAIFVYYYVNRDKISSKLADIYSDVVKNYKSLETNDENSLAVLLVQGPLQCCGDYNYTDFKSMLKTDKYNGQSFSSLTAPVPCCKLDTGYAIVDNTCPSSFEDKNSNWLTGCRTEIKHLLEKNLNIISYVMIGIFLVLLAIMATAIFAACCC